MSNNIGEDMMDEREIAKSGILSDTTDQSGVRIIEYAPFGVCSKHIHIEIGPDGKIKRVEYVRGCSGNTQGVAALVQGMSVDEVIARLRGISCNGGPTSCPDQLARALEASF